MLCLVCALYLSGAHWMLLQTAAWTGMLVTRVQTTTVAEAVQSTFSGDEPCGLCTVIAKQQQDEHGQQPDAPVVKKADDFKLVTQARTMVPGMEMQGEVNWPRVSRTAVARVEQPSTPPPNA